MNHSAGNLKMKLSLLENLSVCETENAEAFAHRLEVLKDIALSLLEEIEALEHVRSINLRRGINLHEELRRFEVHLVQTALERTGGHQTQAAKLLGINLTTLHNKLKRLNISPNIKVSAAVFHEDAENIDASGGEKAASNLIHYQSNSIVSDQINRR